MAYKKCVSFWGIQTAMQRNLETLESQLERFRISISKKPDAVQQKAYGRPQTRKDSWTDGPSLPVTSSDAQDKQADGQQFTLPKSPKPISPGTNFHFDDDHSESHQQPQGKSPHQSQIPRADLASPSPAVSVLDFMNLSSQSDTDFQLQAQHSDGGMSIPPSYNIDQDGIMYSGIQEGQSLNMDDDPLQGFSFEMQLNGWNEELPNYIDGLLSGAGMY